MKQSEHINELATAMSMAQGEIKNAVADAENPHFKSTYADLASVRAAIRKPMSDNGLSIVQLPVTLDGNPALTTRLMHKSGQWLEDTIILLVEKPTMQGLGSAITYAKRYSLAALVGLAEEDDDGNESEKHPLKTPKQPEKRPSPLVLSASAAKPVVTTPGTTTASPGGGLATEKQRKMLWARIKNLDFDDASAKEFFIKHSGKESSKEWTRADFDKVLSAVEKLENASEYFV